jgi:gluconokinase
MKPRVIVLMGVAGSGKTTIGPLLARALGWNYAEGDQFHPPANVAKMRGGTPLDDSDRAPWLAAMAASIRDWIASDTPTVLAASALKQRYRDTLQQGSKLVRFVWLNGDLERIAARMAARKDHFMPPALLRSQFATLEPPADALEVGIDATPAEIVADIVARLDGEDQCPASGERA